MSRRTKGTVEDVSKRVRKQVNIYTLPFNKRTSKDLRNFIRLFFKYVAGEIKKVRSVSDSLQAVVRNPMLRAEYGKNTRYWAKVKGFNRRLFDTGQLFKNIKASVRKRRVPK
jgi:hypothetical protein